MENTAEKYEAKKRHIERKALMRLTIVALVVLLLVLGLSRAWFVNQNNITTLMQVTEPSPIAIRGPHGEALSALDMSYTDDDKHGDTVTIRRVVSVSSNEEKHKMEIVHTTNLKGLTFKVYAAQENAAGSNSVNAAGSNSVNAGNYTYTYNADKPIAGTYINEGSSTADYKYADNSKHAFNFDQYGNVQAHAEPIYWLANESQTGRDADNDSVASEYLNYYVIEISWTETTKETDIFYLLVKNA